MSTIITKNAGNKYKFNIEFFNSANEVVETCKTRTITDSLFKDKSKDSGRPEWTGVKDYEEALMLLRDGYEPVISELSKSLKGSGLSSKRVEFHNSAVGFMPLVPLALQGVPCNMLDMRMKPIKAKVLDIYYDMTASSGTDKDDLIKAGSKILSAVIDLEKSGYKLNLYAMQNYTDCGTGDIMVVKVKSSNMPLDLRRISFPLTHTAFFRVIGFDWYSRFPLGKYRMGYGRSFMYEVGDDKAKQITRDLFGDKAVLFSAQRILGKSDKDIMEVIKNASSN